MIKRLLLTLALTLSVVGCAPQVQVVTETKYIVRTAPLQLKEIPERDVELVEVETDEDLAIFIASTEEYIKLLKGRISSLILYYEKTD